MSSWTMRVELEEVELEVAEEVAVVDEETTSSPRAEADEALDELEAEELELLEDEVSESILVDEVAELRAIRREELTMDLDAHAVREGEFVCRSCFLVKRTDPDRQSQEDDLSRLCVLTRSRSLFQPTTSARTCPIWRRRFSCTDTA